MIVGDEREEKELSLRRRREIRARTRERGMSQYWMQLGDLLKKKEEESYHSL